jgi:NAD+ synthase (glutamine-hydrolysing)
VSCLRGVLLPTSPTVCEIVGHARIVRASIEKVNEQGWSVAEMAAAGFIVNPVTHAVRLVEKAEFQRRQSAPGIKNTPRACGKNRRVPITKRFREEAA